MTHIRLAIMIIEYYLRYTVASLNSHLEAMDGFIKVISCFLGLVDSFIRSNLMEVMGNYKEFVDE